MADGSVTLEGAPVSLATLPARVRAFSPTRARVVAPASASFKTVKAVVAALEQGGVHQLVFGLPPKPLP